MREKIKKKMKIKIPKSYIVVFIIIILIAIYLIGSWFGWFSPNDLFHLISTFIIGWISIILLAIIGAGIIGMLFGYKIFAIRNFTPFEEGVLEMIEDIKEIKERLGKIEEELKRK